jgi:glucosylceramidase
MQTMSALHRFDPSIDQIVSECSPGIIPYDPVEAAISATRNWASAVLLWNLALDLTGGPVQLPNYACTGCTGMIAVSEQAHRATLGLNYFQFGQMSKFVHRGAVRISSTRLVKDYRTGAGAYGVTPGLDDVAFLNPDRSKVLVVYNQSQVRRRFAVGWRTRTFKYALPAGATATFTWK